MPARDEFTKETKDIVAKRVGLRCSNPNCRRPTSGPQAHPVAGRHVDSRTSGTTSSGGWTRRAARLRRFAMRVPGATAVEAVTAASCSRGRNQPGFLRRLRGRVALGSQQEIDSLPAGIDRAVQKPFLTLHLNVGLIDPPALISRFQMRPAALVQLRPVSLHPTPHTTGADG